MTDELIIRCSKWNTEVVCALEPRDAEALHNSLDRLADIPGVSQFSGGYPERPDREVTAKSLSARLSSLDEDALKNLNALIDVIEFGDLNLTGMNWMLSFLDGELRIVRRLGPAALLEESPLCVLSDLAHALDMHWMWMMNGLDMLKGFPRLFGVEPPEPVGAK